MWIVLVERHLTRNGDEEHYAHRPRLRRCSGVGLADQEFWKETIFSCSSSVAEVSRLPIISTPWIIQWWLSEDWPFLSPLKTRLLTRRTVDPTATKRWRPFVLAKKSGEAEVAELHIACRVEQDVLALDVTMHDVERRQELEINHI